MNLLFYLVLIIAADALAAEVWLEALALH